MDLFCQSNVSAFNILSRLVITFLPRSKRLNFMSAITICRDFGARPPKWSLTVSTISPSISHEVMGSVQFNSVAQLCLTLCDPMNHSMSGFPVHHQGYSVLQEVISWHLFPPVQGKSEREMQKNWQISFFVALNSLQMMIADLKLQDDSLLAEKLWKI